MQLFRQIWVLLFIFLSGCLIAQVKITNISFEGLDKTKQIVIRNELNLFESDLIIEADLDSLLELECEQLYNLQLFHWVKYKTSIDSIQHTAEILYTFQERWYFWPIPIFSLADRNFGSWVQNNNLRRLDYGLHLVLNNFRGRNEVLKSNVQEGYNKKYELFYTIPYINSKQNLGLEFATSYARSHFVDYDLKNNKLLTAEFDSYPIQRFYTRGTIFYRKSVINQIFLRNEFNVMSISDSVNKLNNDYFLGEKKSKYLNLEMEYVLNKRNNFSYPEKGYFLNFKYSQRIGISNVNLTNSILLGEVSKYSKLNKKWLISSSMSGSYNLNNRKNFIDNKALGYEKTVRGYELYVLNGTSFFLSKNEFKCKLIDNEEMKLNFIKSSKFNSVPLNLYLSVHGDFGSVKGGIYEASNALSGSWQYGYGFGVHIVSYYDRVMILEYSINKMNEKGFFISTKFPI